MSRATAEEVMPTGPWNRVVQQIRRAVGLQSSDGVGDADLLRRFAVAGDQQAFADLVQRHAALVRSVCRRIVGDEHHADDAFQATFLVLARKAGSVRRPERLSGWLYGVACRVSRKARGIMNRQRVQPGPIEDVAVMSVDGDWKDLRPVLDEEVNRLPECYRAPIILCYLEGKTNEEAARTLGCPGGTVASRLARGRDLLRGRLERRGLALSAGGLAAALPGFAAAAVPAEVVESAIRAGLQFAAGAGAEGPAATLAQGAIHAMFLARVKVFGAVAVVLMAALGGAGVLVHRAGGETVAVEAAPPAVAPPPLKLDAYGDPLPAGALLRLGTNRLRFNFAALAAIAPSGSLVATVEQTSRDTPQGSKEERIIRIHDIASGRETRSWHLPGRESIWSIQLSADGSLLAIPETTSGGAQVWDTKTGKLLKTLGQPGSRCHHVSLSADGKLLVAGNGLGRIDVYDVESGKLVRQIAPGKNSGSTSNQSGREPLRISADGKVVVVLDEQRNLRAHSVASGDVLAEFRCSQPGNNSSCNMAVAPDGLRLAFLSESYDDCRIDLFDVKAKAALPPLKMPVRFGNRTAAFSPDGKSLAAVGVDGITRVFDIESGKVTFSKPGDNRFLAFLEKGEVLASVGGSDHRTLRRWKLANGEEMDPFPGHFGGIGMALVLPGGRFLTGGGTSLILWDQATGKLQRRMVLGKDSSALAVSPDGRLLAGQLREKVLSIWDLATGDEVKQIAITHQHARAAAFSADGRTLFVSNGSITRYDVASGKPTGSLDGAGTVDCLAVSPDGTRVAGGTHRAYPHREFPREPGTREPQVPQRPTPGRVLVWDLAAGDRQPRIVGENPAGVLQIAFAPDGHSILSIGKIEMGQEVEKTAGASSKGDQLKPRDPSDPPPKPAYFGDYKVRIWEIATGKERLAFGDGVTHFYRFAISPDGRTLAAAGFGTGIRLFDMIDGKQVSVLGSPELSVTTLSFASDGKTLITGQYDTTALVWELPARLDSPRAADAKQLDAWWTDLQGDDAGRAYVAVCGLSREGKNAAPLLRDRYEAMRKTGRERVDKMIADLDSTTFADRQKATEELRKLGQIAVGALEKVLEGKPSLDLRKRIEGILTEIRAQPLAPDQRTGIRTVEALQRAGGDAAIDILRHWSTAMEDARVQAAARAAYQRLSPTKAP